MRQGVVTTDPNEIDAGDYQYIQDPDSGAIIRQWVPGDNPDTTDVDEGTFPCMARGFISAGINGNGSGENWTSGGDFVVTQTIRLTFPKNVPLTSRDRITNITDSSRTQFAFVEGAHSDQKPTVFDVQGITPVLDAFGKLVEYTAILTRSEVQDAT